MTDRPWILNARMYAVAPEAEAAWQALLAHVVEDAGLTGFAYEAYPAPQPLEHLWSRSDLGAVQMCGFPQALGIGHVQPLAAPIPDADWAGGRAIYHSDLIVRDDAPYQRLEDTFGGRVGWTVEHSQSGFNAFRHLLLRHRTPERPQLYRESVGPLVTARRILDGVREGTIDIGPLDAYWHRLIALHRPELTRGIRVIGRTASVPVPCFVASAGLPKDAREALRAAFLAAAGRPWFATLAPALCLTGFAPIAAEDYAVTLSWKTAAEAAGYPVPA